MRRKSLQNAPCASMTKFARGLAFALHYVHSDRGAQCAYAMTSRPLVQQQAISANTCLDLGEGRSVAYATAPAGSRRRGLKGDR